MKCGWQAAGARGGSGVVYAQGSGGLRHKSRLRARWHRQWATLGSAAAGLKAVVAQGARL